MPKRIVEIYLKCILLALVVAFMPDHLCAAERIPIKVESFSAGAPIKMGIPFARGVLNCPDQVRLLNHEGIEIPAQINLVTTWEPLDYSVKWLWVFFFCQDSENYFLEYGPNIRKAKIEGPKIKIKNAQRSGQTTMVQTGKLQFSIPKKGGGFIDDVLFDLEGDGFGAEDTIALAQSNRSSFVDLLDDLGIDSSKAVVHRTVRERGSGPLHAILRLEGNYYYSRPDNRASPFVIRLHLYAGKSYIRAYHTLTYTGVPDKHKPMEGEHANIALSAASKVIDDSESLDSGWIQPNDQIASAGISLAFNLERSRTYKGAYQEGSWATRQEAKIFNAMDQKGAMSIFQTGPKPDRIPPVPNSGPEQRISGFHAKISVNGRIEKEIERASGWADVADNKWGVAIGIRHFLEEYPKEIYFDSVDPKGTAYFWSPKAGPLSFARHSLERDQGMISNFAEGVTKTSEMVLFFHPGETSAAVVDQTMKYFLQPPVPHASPETYSNSTVFGHFSPRTDRFLDLERSLDYKFDWEIFSQHWEPWYGMLDFGDQKNAYFKDQWYRWQNNEPAIDFMYWLQFMRTGSPKYFFAAEAMSRHTMDVDNVHWPTDEPYFGDTNESLDWWQHKSKASTANPYLGVGRRHAKQHWVALLSAHVWLQGWVTSYYLTGYHRGLDIARLTADSYLRRIWGDHGLTGRRLYLSVWNLVEAWDATKDDKYHQELLARIDKMIDLQNGPNQYDNLVMDRYGYTQIYASHGLSKYHQLTGDERTKQALLRHARAVRDNPPYNHEYESYLSTIHSLVLGFQYSGDQSFLDEAVSRAKVLKVDPLPVPFNDLGNQKNIAEALEAVSHLPKKGDFAARARWVSNWGPTQGLRVFGWTHIYNIPWLIHALSAQDDR